MAAICAAGSFFSAGGKVLFEPATHFAAEGVELRAAKIGHGEILGESEIAGDFSPSARRIEHLEPSGDGRARGARLAWPPRSPDPHDLAGRSLCREPDRPAGVALEAADAGAGRRPGRLRRQHRQDGRAGRRRRRRATATRQDAQVGVHRRAADGDGRRRRLLRQAGRGRGPGGGRRRGHPRHLPDRFAGARPARGRVGEARRAAGRQRRRPARGRGPGGGVERSRRPLHRADRRRRRDPAHRRGRRRARARARQTRSPRRRCSPCAACRAMAANGSTRSARTSAWRRPRRAWRV